MRFVGEKKKTENQVE